MADERNDEPEGWDVPFRTGVIAGVAVPLVLLAAVIAGGVIYDHTLRARLRFTVTPQPAPGLDARIHAGVRDPETTPVPRPSDPAVARAKAEIVAEGLPGWTAR